MNNQFFFLHLFISFPFFIGLRFLDYFSTFLAMNKYGAWADIEANPIPQYLIQRFGFGLFLLINLCISCIGFILSKQFKRANVILIIFNTIQIIVITTNFLTFLLI